LLQTDASGFVVKRAFSSEAHHVIISKDNIATDEIKDSIRQWLEEIPGKAVLLQPYVATLQDIAELRVVVCDCNPVIAFATKWRSDDRQDMDIKELHTLTQGCDTGRFDRFNDPRVSNTHLDILPMALSMASRTVRVLGASGMPLAMVVAQVDLALTADCEGLMVNEVHSAGMDFFFCHTDRAIDVVVAEALRKWILRKAHLPLT